LERTGCPPSDSAGRSRSYERPSVLSWDSAGKMAYIVPPQRTLVHLTNVNEQNDLQKN
jgi:hypothetical protein